MVRPATPQDRHRIGLIWRAAWASAQPDTGHVAPLAHWLERMDTEFLPPCEVWVVEQAGVAVAFMAMDPGSQHVAQLFTTPAHQGQRLGRQLLDLACQRMPQGWSLYVAAGNHRARQFYVRYGLVPGAHSLHPTSKRERLEFHWRKPGL
jgi:putative acetyltransferase